MADELKWEDFMSFLKVIRQLLGISSADEALAKLGEDIAIVRANTEKIIMSQNQAQADVELLRQDMETLKTAVDTFTSGVRTELDAAKADAQAAHAEAEALREAAANSPTAVPVELQDAIDATHNAVVQLVQSMTKVDEVVAAGPDTTAVAADAEGQARA
jgi:chromosome segregation ATPase